MYCVPDLPDMDRGPVLVHKLEWNNNKHKRNLLQGCTPKFTSSVTLSILGVLSILCVGLPMLRLAPRRFACRRSCTRLGTWKCLSNGSMKESMSAFPRIFTTHWRIIRDLLLLFQALTACGRAGVLLARCGVQVESNLSTNEGPEASRQHAQSSSRSLSIYEEEEEEKK
jgi:hypothetical protein